MSEIQVIQHSDSMENPRSVNQVLAQLKVIQDCMSIAMKDGEHYGKVPGCGDKPTLLKAGAEKLALLFRLTPRYEIQQTSFDHGHREYRIVCSVHSIGGTFLGQGVGVCSTMEGKYRYRVAPKKLTKDPVPKTYWDLRAKDPAKAQEMIGGKGFSTKKDENGVWMIAEGSSDKVEHDNPADYYNTCLKIGKKRSFVDAMLTVTAASDIFTQDVEEIAENIVQEEKRNPASKPAPTHPNPSTQTAKPRPIDDSEGQDSQETQSGPESAADEIPMGDGRVLETIEAVEDKQGKKGPYWTVRTDKGSYICLEASLATLAREKMADGWGVEIKFTQNGKYLNLTAIS